MTDSSTDPRSEQSQAPTVAFNLRPVGIIHASHTKRAKLPKYFVPRGRATLELFHPYLSGFQGLYGGLEVWVITYHAPTDRIPADSWQSLNGAPGVFATTSIERPNPIEFLRARVVDLVPELGLLHVEGLDADDGAPILDIRPATSPHHRLTRLAE